MDAKLVLIKLLQLSEASMSYVTDIFFLIRHSIKLQTDQSISKFLLSMTEFCSIISSELQRRCNVMIMMM